MPQPPRLACCGLVCDADRLMEVQRDRILLGVNLLDVRRVTLRHGLQAPHPIAQVAAGALLLATAYFPAAHLLHWFLHGGLILTEEAWLVALAALGGWMLLTAFRRGFFLVVEGPAGRKRFAFRPDPDARQLDAFLAAIEARSGQTVGRDESRVPG